MKQIELTKGYFAKVDDSDFEWLSQWKWNANVNSGHVYAVRNYRDSNGKYKTVYMHRQVAGAMSKPSVVDHINGNGLDNTRGNLRVCTHRQNLMNRGASVNSTSKFKGVSWDKASKMWVAAISINGKQTHLGRYNNEYECARVFNHYAKIHHGDFAKLNDVTPLFPS